MDFRKWPKIPRLNRDIIVTEKIDGTNAQITVVKPDHEYMNRQVVVSPEKAIAESPDGRLMFAGSRNRRVTPDKDNYGFAQWVTNNAEELFQLGLGRFYGEWWGQKIQRGYGLKERRFSLFHTDGVDTVPEIVHTVPVIYSGGFSADTIDTCLEYLRTEGSFAAPGFMRPEGIIIFHVAANQMFKVTLEKDEVPKSKS